VKLRTPQYWLAELDQYGNPKLVDGSHDSPEGANKAAYLIQAMHLGKPGRTFAVAKVELTECVPSANGVDHEAVRAINAARAAVRRCSACGGTGAEFPGRPRTEKCEECNGSGRTKGEVPNGAL
jgi:hypothetical protein